MTLLNCVLIFKEWMLRMGYSTETIRSYGRLLNYFLQWLEDQKIKTFDKVNQSDLDRYCEYLHKKKNQVFGGGLSCSYIQGHINVIRLLDQYLQLSGKGKLLRGKLPVEQDFKVHRTILTQKEIKTIYELTQDSPMGLRDRAVLGLYYGCGLRCSEGLRVELKHIDYEKKLLYVLAGKNGRSRQVPISQRVKRDFKDYQCYGRNDLLKSQSTHFLINYFGGKIKRGYSLNKRLRLLTEQAGIAKKISLHCLRHSIATHLLQQGMPLEQISQFLGHTSLDSTQIYTRLAEELED